MSDELPEGWASARIADVFEVNPRKPAADLVHESTPVTFVPMGAVDADRGAITAPQERAFGAVRKGYTAFADGDVLLAKITPCFENGKAAVTSSLRNGLGFGSSEFHVFRPQGAVLAPYLFQYLRQPQLRAHVADFMTGTAGQARVPIDQVGDLELPIAPLAEQRRIVAKVEALLDQVRRAKSRLDCVPPMLKRFRQAVLAAASSGELTETWRAKRELRPMRESIDEKLGRASQVRTRRGVPKNVALPSELEGRELPPSWTWASVAELLRASFLLDVKDGNHGENHPKVAEFTDDGLPFITAAQVKDFSIDYAGAYKLAGAPLARINVGHAKSGDAILTHKGSVGRTAVCDRNCVLTPQTTYYRPDVDVIDARFLMYLFAAPVFFAQLAAVMSQTTRDFVPISEQYSLFLPLPTVDEQREIARRVDALFAYATPIEHRVEHAAIRATSLPQAILSKAFAGELVPTEADLARAEGRDYETAEQLLEKVRAQAVESPTTKRPRTTSGRRRSRSTANT